MKHPQTPVAFIAVAALAAWMIVPVPAAQAAVRFDVVGSPTEVVLSGRSEVLGSVNLFVRDASAVTGTAMGGDVQIGVLLADPALEIDNVAGAGISLFAGPGFAAAAPSIIGIANMQISGRCAGQLTINLRAGATPAAGEFIRIEGIRGRIDRSSAITAGTNLFASLQSANDPAAASFFPDRVRVATSFRGLLLQVISSEASLEIRLAEGFARALVDGDAGDDGINFKDRTDSGGQAQGAPTNSTQVLLRIDGIPDGVSNVTWPASPADAVSGAVLRLSGSSFGNGSATALYSFETPNQTGRSDVVSESFTVEPSFVFGGGRCNPEDMRISAALAPAAEELSVCAPPSASASRPRFRQVWELALRRLSPSSATAGPGGIALTVLGTGFVRSSQVLWNGSPRPTAFVDEGRLTASIPAGDLARPGSALVTVSSPADLGGAVSNELVFQITPIPLTLVYPRLAVTQGRAQAEFTGIALANLDTSTADLRFTALGTGGSAVAGSGIQNPVTLRLEAGKQLPLLSGEIFGPGADEADRIAWIKVEGSLRRMTGFFLNFDHPLSFLDGGEAHARAATTLVIPEIRNPGFTLVHAANPSPDPAAVTLELLRADGFSRTTPAIRRLAPNGAFSEPVASLFPGTSPEESDYIRLSSNTGTVAFERFGVSGSDDAGLGGLDAQGGSRALYAPQYVVGSGWRSRLTIVNLSDRAGRVTLRLVADAGLQVGSAREANIPARGKLHIADPGYFAAEGPSLIQGYVEILSDGILLTGSAVFTGGGRRPGTAALPLASDLRDEMVFSHVASGSEYFTGLAILNPNEGQTAFIIQVFDREGKVIASRSAILAARSRQVGLLTEFFPALASREISGGYILVKAMRNVAAFSLFGSHGLEALAAIPAQIIP